MGGTAEYAARPAKTLPALCYGQRPSAHWGHERDDLQDHSGGEHQHVSHILHMMFALKSRRPDLLDSRDKMSVLRSNSNIRFKEDKSNYEVCTKSPYVRGCTLWNKLPAHIQSVITRKEFDILLTPEILSGL